MRTFTTIVFDMQDNLKNISSLFFVNQTSIATALYNSLNIYA